MPESPSLSWSELRDLPISAWHPRQKLQLPATEVARAAFPAIDVHNHLGRWLSDGEWMIDDVESLVSMMDARHVEAIVNLDGMWGDELDANIARYDRAHPGRFHTFCQVEWSRLAESGGALGESGEDQAVPALAEQGEGAGQGVEVAEGSESWGS